MMLDGWADEVVGQDASQHWCPPRTVIFTETEDTEQIDCYGASHVMANIRKLPNITKMDKTILWI